MLVSIIINNYNYGSYLAQAIDSALAQTYSPVEVIVVDDGSTDNSRAVIGSYGERIRSVMQLNSGQAAACNAGWRIAKGNFAIFLDSDDVLLPDAVKKCVQRFLETDAEKVQFALQKVDRDLEPLQGIMPSYGLGDERNIERDMKLWGYYLCPPGSGNCYSRSFLEKVMPMQEFFSVAGAGATTYLLAPDGNLSGLAGLFGKVASARETLGLYRVHGKNKSDAGSIESVQKLRKLFMNDYLREKQQGIWAKKLGLPHRPDRSRFHPTVCKLRFIAFRLQPEGHPVPEDTFSGLLASGLWGSVCFPYLSLRKRFFIFCGFLAIGFLPKRQLYRLMGAVAKPEERKNVLSVFRA